MDETTTNPTAPADEPYAKGNPAAAEEAKPEEDDVGWPMDLNRLFDRESVDKATSFHDV